ncbi:MAG: LPXTG cell wall anchor domain-containing protein [Firmicutes bacterium]|nr:LPXTG cell wall anchor domain-containing protein [Bacillota bacterium]
MSDLQKLKLISPVITILIVLTVSVLLLAAAGTGTTFAFVVEGGECGLTVTEEKGFIAGGPNDVSNLNPGDTKGSYLRVSNTGSETLGYFFSIEKISSKPGRGGTGEPLDKILQLTVKRGGETLFTGLITDFNTELNMGNLAVGDEQQLDISVYFPGEAGNEYQGADVSVRFKLRAVCGGSGGPPGGDDDDEPTQPPGDSDDDEPTQPPGGDGELVVTPEPPGKEGPGEQEPPDSEKILAPEEPAAMPPPDEQATPPTELEVYPELPKTGEFPRPVIYGIGVLLLLAGLLLRKKFEAKKQD